MATRTDTVPIQNRHGLQQFPQHLRREPRLPIPAIRHDDPFPPDYVAHTLFYPRPGRAP